jgi:hypothetical protein
LQSVLLRTKADVESIAKNRQGNENITPTDTALRTLFKGTIPPLNDTEKDLLSALIGNSNGGVTTEALSQATGITSLKRPVTALNKGALATIGKRIQVCNDHWTLVDGSQWKK